MLAGPGGAVPAGQPAEVDEVALVGGDDDGQAVVVPDGAEARQEVLQAQPAGGVRQGEDQQEAVGPRERVLARLTRCCGLQRGLISMHSL